MTGDEQLRRAIARLRRPSTTPPPLKPEPGNPFEIAVAERLKHLQCQLDQLNTRLWWLLTVIVGAAILNIILGLVTQ